MWFKVSKYVFYLFLNNLLFWKYIIRVEKLLFDKKLGSGDRVIRFLDNYIFLF